MEWKGTAGEGASLRPAQIIRLLFGYGISLGNSPYIFGREAAIVIGSKASSYRTAQIQSLDTSRRLLKIAITLTFSMNSNA
jgi:hypothetical protein